jgi:hypothetical protein
MVNLTSVKGNVDTGIYLLFASFLGLIVLGALSTTTSGLFSSLGEGMSGFSGLVVSNFNVILLLSLTILGFIGLVSLRT